jgi:lipid A ethanolaminephosphotransferase
MLRSNDSRSFFPRILESFKSVSEVRLIVFVSLFVVIFGNKTFFGKVTEVYPVSFQHILFLVSLFILVVGLTVVPLILVASKYTTKPVLIFVLLLTAFCGYFMDSYNVVIDQTMLINTYQTNPEEAGDLISVKLILYLLFIGLLPAFYVWKVDIRYVGLGRFCFNKTVVVGGCLVGLFIMVALQGKTFASFFREHKPIRYYVNPSYCLYSAAKFVEDGSGKQQIVVAPIGLDAVQSASATGRRLVIFVVGESARADRFSLNGYNRETNPLLKKRDVISFKDFTASGTSTAISVPIMFSNYPRKEASMKKVKATENILDVLQRAEVQVLWRDNNSSSKGVADRVEYQDYKIPENNTIYDVEARDEGMLVGLQDYIDGVEEGDILILLHQMGCHGPAYYKRYPKAFETFTPVCETNQLNECTDEEISNAYDNVILYTDYVLSKTIDLLEENEGTFKTAMFYVADHGKSLGENGVYLHGFPYAFAPEAQTRVPAVLWLGEGMGTNKNDLKAIEEDALSHDNIFHTLLGMFQIETEVYHEDLDFLKGIENVDNSLVSFMPTIVNSEDD